MDVAADDAVVAAMPCQLRGRLLIAPHVVHRVADA